MPWYDFQCESCGNVFETQRPMGDARKPRCKYCASTRTVKIYSAAGIQFKGGGFYATDSRSGGRSPDSDKPADKADNGSKAEPAKEAKAEPGARKEKKKAT